MKKLWDKIKKIRFDLRVFLIILIVLINFILLFKPEIFKNKISYITVKAKKSELNGINNGIVQGTNDNTNKTMEVADLREQDAELEKRAMVNRKEIDPNGLEFHLPSILIRLEDSSKANNLSIAIEYSEIKYQDIQGNEIDLETEPEDEDQETLDSEDKKDLSLNDYLGKNVLLSKPNSTSLNSNNGDLGQMNIFQDPLKELDKIDKELEDNKSSNDTPAEPDEESQEDTEDTDLDGLDEEEKQKLEEKKARFQEEGVEVTQIPVEVKGTYAGVKRFIKDLDQYNYLEPSKVEIKSLGQTVEAKIIISVFHGDIFR